MKEINEAVLNHLDKMASGGEFEKMIAVHLEKCVETCIKESFREYGEFGKNLKAKVEESLQVAHRNVTIPAYNKFICEVVQNTFSEVLQANALNHLKTLIEKKIPKLNKVEKTSHLIDQVREMLEDAAVEQGLEYIKIECEYNDDDTACYVTIHDPEYDFQNVTLTFYNFSRGREDHDDVWHIGYLCEGSNHVSGPSINGAKICREPLTELLFQYYAMNTKFEMDTEFENIYVGH